MSLFLQIITIYTVCTHFYDVWWSCHSPVIQWILINGCFGAVYILRCSDWDDQVLVQTTNLSAFFLAIMPKYNNVSTHSRRKYDCCTFHSSLRSLSFWCSMSCPLLLDDPLILPHKSMAFNFHWDTPCILSSPAADHLQSWYLLYFRSSVCLFYM